MSKIKNLGVLIFFLFILLMMLNNAPSFWGDELSLRVLYTAMFFGFVTSAFYIVTRRNI